MATLLCIATFVDFDERMIPDKLLSPERSSRWYWLHSSRRKVIDTEQLQADHLVYLTPILPRLVYLGRAAANFLLYAMGMMGDLGSSKYA